ncbi:unnamed protein product [Calicophoron daubneyi]|uniref:Gelsolin-like domain-containing protein n=1 Tax=Calicophoron daubneyi TaxID=300641 RepID=A0AAV2T4C5_CALDB
MVLCFTVHRLVIAITLVSLLNNACAPTNLFFIAPPPPTSTARFTLIVRLLHTSIDLIVIHDAMGAHRDDINDEMAKLATPKEYSWKDSNLALFSSEKDREIKKGSADKEPAWDMVKKINSKTLVVWRIKNFKLEEVSKEDFGKFFSGDSYLILSVDHYGGELVYDVHFWIGKESTPDEYGTAAYKAVELDTLLDDKAIQHREVDGFESDQFKRYFNRLEKLEGGYTSGFMHVKPEEFRHRLLVCHGLDRNHVELTEVDFSRNSIDSGDVFILDVGTTAYQWNGKGSSKDERYRAGAFLQQLESERNGRCTTFVIDEIDNKESAEFLAKLPDAPVHKRPEQVPSKKAIYRISDETGKMQVSLVCEEHLPKSALRDDDAFIIDTGMALFVYIGVRCSRNEKLNALSHAHEYLKKTTHPLIPITVVSGGRISREMEKVLE